MCAGVISRLLKEPERLRTGLDAMIEQAREAAHGDLEAEIRPWLDNLAEVGRKRRLLPGDGRRRLDLLRRTQGASGRAKETRTVAERELRSLKHRREWIYGSSSKTRKPCWNATPLCCRRLWTPWTLTNATASTRSQRGGSNRVGRLVGSERRRFKRL